MRARMMKKAPKRNSNHGEWRFVSPLRYPGGKLDLSNYVKLIVELNALHDMVYVEPYAGGASVGLDLLYNEYAKRIYINDLSTGVFAFWDAAINNTELLADAVDAVPLTVGEWRRQRAVQGEDDPDPFDLGFSTFYLNRTNRSGIIKGGIIGGLKQDGPWKMNARFNRNGLADRIRRVGRFGSRITLSNLDASEFLARTVEDLPSRSLLYLDPPYVRKGRHLYADYYDFADHKAVAQLIQLIQRPWLVSYDYHPSLFKLYKGRRYVVYSLSYHAQDRYAGKEVIFFSDDLDIPDINRPTKISLKQFRRLLEQMKKARTN